MFVLRMFWHSNRPEDVPRRACWDPGDYAAAVRRVSRCERGRCGQAVRQRCVVPGRVLCACRVAGSFDGVVWTSGSRGQCSGMARASICTQRGGECSGAFDGLPPRSQTAFIAHPPPSRLAHNSLDPKLLFPPSTFSLLPAARDTQRRRWSKKREWALHPATDG